LKEGIKLEEKFYTIDQIADLLGMHHKTIRKFINEGKLGARKVGKQWRISVIRQNRKKVMIHTVAKK